MIYLLSRISSKASTNVFRPVISGYIANMNNIVIINIILVRSRWFAYIDD